MTSYRYSAQPTNKQASSIQQATIMADWSLYPNATEPTAPRFQVGELVYTRSSQRGANVEPGVFGVIIEEPEKGTIVQDSETISRSWEREWEGVENPTEEADIDLPGSGSVVCPQSLGLPLFAQQQFATICTRKVSVQSHKAHAYQAVPACVQAMDLHAAAGLAGPLANLNGLRDPKQFCSGVWSQLYHYS